MKLPSLAAAAVAALILAVPNAGSAHAAALKPGAQVTITGRSHWVLFIDALEVANGYRSDCDAINGAVTLWGATKARVIKTIANKPVVEAHSFDAQGDETWICHMNYRVTVTRQPKYAIAWNNATPYENYGCSNSKSRSDAEIWNQTQKATTHTVPTIGFTYLCTA